MLLAYFLTNLVLIAVVRRWCRINWSSMLFAWSSTKTALICF